MKQSAPVPINIQPEELRNLYINKGLSSYEIASIYNCAQRTVYKHLKKHHIPIRSQKKVIIPDDISNKLNDRVLMHNMYIERGISCKDIGSTLGVSGNTVALKLKRHNIPIKTPSDYVYNSSMRPDLFNSKEWMHEQYTINRLSSEDIAKIVGIAAGNIRKKLTKLGIIKRTSQESLLHGSVLVTDKKWLYEQYVTLNQSVVDISKTTSTSNSTVHRNLIKFGIPVRDSRTSQSLNPDSFKFLDSKEWMYEQYIVSEKSLDSIAIELGSTTFSVSKALNNHGIIIRHNLSHKGISSVHRHQLVPLLEKYGINHTTSYKISIGKYHYEIDEYLPDLKIFLELQGVYWHNLGDKETSQNKHRITSDMRKHRLLIESFPDHKIVCILDTNFKTDAAENIVKSLNQ